MNQPRLTFLELIVKTIVTHTVMYFIVGLFASVAFDYASLYAQTNLNLLMRQVNEPLVMAGPLFQPIRGLLFGAIFYLLREPFFGKKNGWLVMWAALVAIGIIGTFGPTPSSLEGMVYTTIPLWIHLKGLPEVLLQSLLLSVVLFYWVHHPEKKWLSWSMGIAVLLVLFFPALGLLVGQLR